MECVQHYGSGCGEKNIDKDSIKCPNCSQILKTVARKSGEKFHRGEKIYFYCNQSYLREGIVVRIANEGNGDDKLIIKYAKEFKDDRYDLKLSADEIFKTIESADESEGGRGGRSRKSVQRFTV